MKTLIISTLAVVGGVLGGCVLVLTDPSPVRPVQVTVTASPQIHLPTHIAAPIPQPLPLRATEVIATACDYTPPARSPVPSRPDLDDVSIMGSHELDAVLAEYIRELESYISLEELKHDRAYREYIANCFD